MPPQSWEVQAPSPGRSTAAPGVRLVNDRGNRQYAAVRLERIAWTLVVAGCVITAVLLLLAGYVGYAAVSAAVGVSAAINLL